MRKLALAGLVLLALSACTATPGAIEPAQERINQTTDTGPLPREDPSMQQAPVLTNNLSNQTSINETFENLSYNDDGYEEWRRQARNAVVLLVSDGEQAARAYLQETEQVTLDLRTQITIKVGAVEQGKAQLIIDNRSELVEEDSEAYNSDKSIIVYLSETITT